ncbi:MAG: hypothetical protein JSS07_05635 [Proteobacteria bacterium]|nr:hypothetical protein [Pseudomonadota bacterium]
MIQFQALGEGNCLYNSEAVWLVYAFQEKKLDVLLSDKVKVIPFAALLNIVAEQAKIPKMAALLQEITQQNTELAFNQFILHCTENNEINWIKIQLLMAKALRTLVADVIQNMPQVKSEVRRELSTYISNMFSDLQESNNYITNVRSLRLHINEGLAAYVGQAADETVTEIHSFVENEFKQKISSLIESATIKQPQIVGMVKDELNKIITLKIKEFKTQNITALRQAVLKAITDELARNILSDLQQSILPISAHFEGMTVINKKINDILNDPTLDSFSQKEQAFMKWFFKEPATGWKEYLVGEQGIARPGVNAGELEQKVLSVLFSHTINIRSLAFLNENNRRAVDGFNSEEKAKKQPDRQIAFEMEKLSNHWNVLLPKNPNTEKMVQENDSQRNRFFSNKATQEITSVLQEGLKKHGSYAAHNVADLPELRPSEYCNYFGISLKDYVAFSRKRTSGADIDDKTSPPLILPPVMRSIGAEIEDLSDEESEEEMQTEIEQPPLLPKVQQRDWLNYFTMFSSFVFFIGLVSYLLIWPVWLPMMNALFAETLFSPFALSLSVGITSLFCFAVGALLTEKIHSDWEKETNSVQNKKEVVNKEALKKDEPFELKPKQEVLPLFQNKQSQEQPPVPQAQVPQIPPPRNSLGSTQ